jgi:hypothetical protein
MPRLPMSEAQLFEDAKARFLTRLVEQPNGCIHYAAAPGPNGYRLIAAGTKGATGKKRQELAHRFAYRLYHGEIPEGMTVDHQCHNDDPTCPGGPTCWHRPCVHRDHLILRTRGANVLLGKAPTAVNKRKTECIRKHAFTPANTIIDKNGWRACRTCHNDRKRKTPDREVGV